ncbi:hypothetical protein CVT24_011008 [Panaeolus cyanescens]|uniref:DUF6729 domain-containing protein n=1 Tax=Panaeolus cyanescens TaxID=181874 RepID=A0A409WQ96_9AGAR|nr:hypothetical protein CVT24_011008 [Panaeolus cyanescens]
MQRLQQAAASNQPSASSTDGDSGACTTNPTSPVLSSPPPMSTENTSGSSSPPPPANQTMHVAPSPSSASTTTTLPPSSRHIPPSIPLTPRHSAPVAPISFLPGEDPQQNIMLTNETQSDEECSDDDDDDTGETPLERDAEGEGIGVDEDVDREADDVEDPGETRLENLPPPSQQPSWLLERDKFCDAKLQSRDKKGVPGLYSEDHTYWIRKASPSLSLQKSTPSPILFYDSDVFVWDPLAMTPIPCPFCKRPLTRNGKIARLRRCIGIDSTFWIKGYRYRCSHCHHPKSRLRTITFQSWDSRIIQLLPPHIADEFPARFSSRSYYQALATWAIAQYAGVRFPAFPPYDNNGPSGYHGYVPCAAWFRTMYDKFIEEHAQDIYQHTAMLPLNIGALDHSHKLTKRISPVKGQRVIAGVLTVTNENGEIRGCFLVTTTGHSQSLIPLDTISQSHDFYGHDQPRAFYTDNVQGDKRLLETVFKSLTKDVIAVEEYSYLDELQLPDSVTISVENSSTAINTVCQAIMDGLSQDDERILVIGFDSEWNVHVTANDRLYHRESTAIIQIAYKDTIYIFQIMDMLAEHRLPQQLKVLLANPKVIKAGRLIDADLKNLQLASQSTVPFVGGVDLAKLAKQRCVLHNIQT